MSIRQTAVSGQFYSADAKEIRATLKKYNEVLDRYFANNEDIANLKPKAVIVPHAGYIYSGFTANVALRLLHNSDTKQIVVIGPSHRVYLKGTSVSMYDSYATPLGHLKIDKDLSQILKEKFSLTFVPDAHHEHSTEVQMPMIKNYEPDVSVVELVYGEEDPQNLAQVIEYLLQQPQIGVVISSDLSHFYDINRAKRLDSICMDAVAKQDESMLHQGCEACGKIGIEAMITASKKRGLSPKMLDYRTSADRSGDNSSVVGYMSVAFVDAGANETDKDEKSEVLLKLARASIAKAVGAEYDLDLDKTIQENTWLKDNGATFVTLTTANEQLRGCIGSLESHRNLYKDVLENAKSAAIKDPRFIPLKKDEFENITVEVSILTPATPVTYSTIDELRSKIKVGEDGVILEYGGYKATFLPQVWEQLPGFDIFFSHLCKKAGMSDRCLDQRPDISVYQVKKYIEHK